VLQILDKLADGLLPRVERLLGRVLLSLKIADTFFGFSPTTDVRFNFRGVDVVEILERVDARSDSRRRSVSIRVPSSPRANSTCGLIDAASRSISLAPETNGQRVIESYQCVFRHSLRNLPLKDSMKPLPVGLPGPRRTRQGRDPII
jgi:hypothetical protein